MKREYSPDIFVVKPDDFKVLVDRYLTVVNEAIVASERASWGLSTASKLLGD